MTPEQLSDRIVDVLTAAGFDHVAPEPVDVPLWFGPDAATAADFYLGSGPVRAMAREVLADWRLAQASDVFIGVALGTGFLAMLQRRVFHLDRTALLALTFAAVGALQRPSARP